MDLSVWQTMSVHEIRSRIPGAPGAKGRFKAALHRVQQCTLLETNTETQKGPYKDYRRSEKGLYGFPC